MIIMRSPKGWAGPKVVDGPVEGTFRAHQVPITDFVAEQMCAATGEVIHADAGYHIEAMAFH